MNSNVIFKEIMREYEKERLNAKKIRESRETELYDHIPRLGEIDKELAQSTIKISKSILHGEQGVDEQLKNIKEYNDKLINEKKQIIKENGYPDDWLESVFSCNLCKDTGFVKTDRCACLKQKLISKHYNISNLADIVKEENFDSFDIAYYSETPNEKTGISPRKSMENIYKNATGFVENFEKEMENLVFYGGTGLGKTFLCNCIAKEILDLGKSVLYVTSPQLFKIVEDCRFNRDELDDPKEYINTVISVDLLIIDDLGSEFSTIVTAAELFNIVNTRLIDQKHTVISTNLSPQDIINQYSDRVTSRFFGNYKMLKFDGDDIRIIKKYKYKNK